MVKCVLDKDVIQVQVLEESLKENWLSGLKR
jgi:hypothetical protein